MLDLNIIHSISGIFFFKLGRKAMEFLWLDSNEITALPVFKETGNLF